MKNIIAIILAGAAGTVFAASADDMARTTANTAASDYAAAKAKCDTMSGHAKTICIDEAKATRAHTEADAMAQANVSERKRMHAQREAASADYSLAKAKCADENGTERSNCLKNAKSTYTTALADIKANRNVATTRPATTSAGTSTAATQSGSNTADTTGNRVSQATSRAGEAVSDSVITTKVKADLVREPNLSASDIHVDTSNGIVMLSGFVNTRAEADKAVELARTVNGVKEVKSAIKVK